MWLWCVGVTVCCVCVVWFVWERVYGCADFGVTVCCVCVCVCVVCVTRKFYVGMIVKLVLSETFVPTAGRVCVCVCVCVLVCFCALCV